MAKTPNSNSRSKHTPRATILHLRWPSPTGILRSMALLRGQSSSACFPHANRLVETSKVVLAVRATEAPAMRSAMRSAVPQPNQIYKQIFMKNADAKFQAPQYATSFWCSSNQQINIFLNQTIIHISTAVQALCVARSSCGTVDGISGKSRGDGGGAFLSRPFSTS